MKKIWKKPIFAKVPVKKITLNGSNTGTESVNTGRDPKRPA